MSTIGPFELHVRIVGGKNLRDVQTFGKQGMLDPHFAPSCVLEELCLLLPSSQAEDAGGRLLNLST